MSNTKQEKVIEYRVTEVKRYNVTRFHYESSPNGYASGGSESLGMFDNEFVANRVANALCSIDPGAVMAEPNSEIV